MRMHNQRRWYSVALFIATLISVVVVAANQQLNVNNRFVCYAIIASAVICCFLLLYVRRYILMRNMLLAITVMAGFSFALVPLYNVFCAVTGLNGKLDLSVRPAAAQEIDFSRQVTVEFVVHNNAQMPWEFKPKHSSLVVYPGAVAATAYFAKNPTNTTMFAQAIPSITPARVRKYFKKIECFCFNNQKLGPGETAYLGLRFYLDPAFPKDVQRVTLAYTIFDITDKMH
jgi:cytochrome c oxidase assembly protein subunit 11